MESSKSVRFSESPPEIQEYEPTPMEKDEQKDWPPERSDWFVNMMSTSMGIRAPEQLLDDVSFRGIIDYVRAGKARNIIIMAGAGISTSAGLPDYRTPGTGMYATQEAEDPGGPTVEEMFSLPYFWKDPKPFLKRSKIFYEWSIKPTVCHYFIRLLHEKGLLLRHYTQNVDGLELVCGLPEEKVIDVHGTFSTATCTMCDARYDRAWMEQKMKADEIPPLCEDMDCKGIVKPDVCLTGEPVNSRWPEHNMTDTLVCDLLIVMGSSLAMQPFAALTSKVWPKCPRLYVNLDRGKTGKKNPVTDMMFGGSFDFDPPTCYRDVHKQDTCDNAALEMAEGLGWADELREMVAREHERIEREDAAKGKLPPPLRAPLTPKTSSTKTTPTKTSNSRTTTSRTPNPPKAASSARPGSTRSVTLNKTSAANKQGTMTPQGKVGPGASNTSGTPSPKQPMPTR